MPTECEITEKEFELLYNELREKPHGTLTNDQFEFSKFRYYCLSVFGTIRSSPTFYFQLQMDSDKILLEAQLKKCQEIMVKREAIKTLQDLCEPGTILFEPGVNKGNIAYEAFCSNIDRMLKRGTIKIKKYKYNENS